MKKMIMVAMMAMVMMFNMAATAFAVEVKEIETRTSVYPLAQMSERAKNEANEFIKERRLLDDTFTVTSIKVRDMSYGDVPLYAIDVSYMDSVVFGSSYFYNWAQ